MQRITIGQCLLFGVLHSVALADRSFIIENDRFVKDGTPIRIFSGSVHYHRIHPAYWRDRLLRIKAMGLNAIQFLVPWAWHEPRSGEYTFDGWSDLPRYLEIAKELDLLVMLRPGPYICGEWDFGGLPAWLPTSRMTGGTDMHIRSDDPAFLFQVKKWWRVLFARVRPYLYEKGGPIIMVQLENEYGYCEPVYGLERANRYMRALKDMARRGLGDTVILYTTDPPNLLKEGSLPGDEVYSVVDFGANWGHPAGPFQSQAGYNPPGKSPSYNSEFYTGWLTHWGESSAIANQSMEVLQGFFREMLEYNGRTSSFNFYMAHGGTNFGFHAGANTAGNQYQPHITSYDYDSPISEAGDYGQPGYGGPNKFEIIRSILQEHSVHPLPEVPPKPKITAYGPVEFHFLAPLLDNLAALSPGDGLAVEHPEIMEEYGQRWGFILYRTTINASLLGRDAALDFGVPVHDYAQLFIDGEWVASLERSSMQTTVVLPGADKDKYRRTDGMHTLDVLVQAMGHENFGCNHWDRKGLLSPDVKLDGSILVGWKVYNMELEDLQQLAWHATSVAADAASEHGPVFFRGHFHIDPQFLALGNNSGYLPDTFLSTVGWTKGIAWVNGFNLGWYWPTAGPQLTLYVPGPVLKVGVNELVLLEVESPPSHLIAEMSDGPQYVPAAAAISHTAHNAFIRGTPIANGATY